MTMRKDTVAKITIYDITTNGQYSGLQTLLTGASFGVSLMASSAMVFMENFSDKTVNFDRKSSIPMYAPHIRRLPSNAERPCRTR